MRMLCANICSILVVVLWEYSTLEEWTPFPILHWTMTCRGSLVSANLSPNYFLPLTLKPSNPAKLSNVNSVYDFPACFRYFAIRYESIYPITFATRTYLSVLLNSPYLMEIIA